jgi:hypothetical protein
MFIIDYPIVPLRRTGAPPALPGMPETTGGHAGIPERECIIPERGGKTNRLAASIVAASSGQVKALIF